MLSEEKRTWAQISAASLRQNYNNIREYVSETCKVMGVIKADAYGHGAAAVAKLLEDCGCDYLGVATIDEAERLREAGIKLPVLILSYTGAEFLDRVIAADCAQALGSPDSAKSYAKELEKLGKTLRIHIKLETGMGRTGFNIKDKNVSAVVDALGLSCFETEGIFSHFASADDPGQHEYTLGQIELFRAAVAQIEENSGKKFAIKHCANSAAMISYPQAHFDMVRAGIALYGVYPGPDRRNLNLSPAMELRTRIIQISELEPGGTVSYGRTFTADKHMKVAVLPIGYADGLHRNLSGKIDFLIRGKRCRQLGTICMDMCVADVTDIPGATLGDVAVVFGQEDGECIPVTELAEKGGTISYEMLCAVSPRVPRTYEK